MHGLDEDGDRVDLSLKSFEKSMKLAMKGLTGGTSQMGLKHSVESKHK